MFWNIIYFFDWICFIPIAFTVLYIFLFSITSLFFSHTKIPKAKKQNRFIVLIPAYRQDKAILNTVKSILGQSYPQRMFDVIVISDHQSEMTNMHLAQYPITLLTPNFETSTKAKSLQYAIMNLPEFKIYDVVVLLDADNIVESEFLEQINDAYENAGSKAILTHKLPKNRDTASARLDSIFEEINTSIFRRGHTAIGLSAALTGSGVAYEFAWFRNNIMKVRSAIEDKELEALLLRQHIYIDYIDDIYVYDEKTRQLEDLNKQRGRWATNQIRSMFTNIRYLPAAIINRHYDWADKIIQWILVPRIIMMTVIFIMSIVLPFIYMTAAIKWWIAAFVVTFAFALATPNDMVDEHWDLDFMTLPFKAVATIYKKLHLPSIPKIAIPKIKLKKSSK